MNLPLPILRHRAKSHPHPLLFATISGAHLARYLELRQFHAELSALLKSPHPAVTNAVKEALEAIDLPIP